MSENKYCIDDSEFVEAAYEDYENFRQELFSTIAEGQRIVDFCKIILIK